MFHPLARHRSVLATALAITCWLARPANAGELKGGQVVLTVVLAGVGQDTDPKIQIFGRNGAFLEQLDSQYHPAWMGARENGVFFDWWSQQLYVIVAEGQFFQNGDLTQMSRRHPHTERRKLHFSDVGLFNVLPPAVDAWGNYYFINSGEGVSCCPWTQSIVKFSPELGIAASFEVPVDRVFFQYRLEVTASGGLVLYPELDRIRRFDLTSATELAPFSVSSPRALHLLPPHDGNDLLVATPAQILRMDGAGNVTQVYDTPGVDTWLRLDLDVDDSSFWASSRDALYRFDVATGAVLVGPVVTAPYYATEIHVIAERPRIRQR